jgi:hypothetical protein
MIEILYFAGCPNHEPAVELARQVVEELGLEATIREVAVETAEEAERHRFLGSPTIRVNGQDIDPSARASDDFALCCRVYADGGVPPRQMLLDALRDGVRT